MRILVKNRVIILNPSVIFSVNRILFLVKKLIIKQVRTIDMYAEKNGSNRSCWLKIANMMKKASSNAK
jgi:hypothetical protein